MKLREARKKRYNRYQYEFKWLKSLTFESPLSLVHCVTGLGTLFRAGFAGSEAEYRILARVKFKLKPGYHLQGGV